MPTGDEFRTAATGEVRKLTATQFNSWNLAALKAKKPGDLKKGPDPLRYNRGDICLVQNNSGSNVDQFGILQVSAPLILPADNENEFRTRIALAGVTPSSAYSL